MNENKGKMLLKWVGRIVVCFILIIFLWFIFGRFKSSMMVFLTKNFKLEDELAKYENTISVIFGILDIALSIVISVIIPIKMEKREDFPQIVIIPNQTYRSNMSGIKKEKQIDFDNKIELGKKQTKYRIIYAKIVNTGKSMISECCINGQTITFLLYPDNEIPLYLILYDFDKGKSFDYELKYSVQDTNNNLYNGIYCMRLDLKKGVASFHIRKKLKRRLLNNALSNL